MKIALLSYEYPPETGFGGIGTYTWYQARALVRLGHEVRVVAGSLQPGVHHSEHDGVRVTRVLDHGRYASAVDGMHRDGIGWASTRLGLAASAFGAVRDLLEDEAYDIVEYPDCGADGTMVATMLPGHTSVRFHSPAKLIMGLYGADARENETASFLEQVAINRADVRIAPSWFMAAEAVTRLGVSPPIHMVPNGLDLELFDRSQEIDVGERFGVPRSAGTVTVLVTGRLERRKGSHLLPGICAEVLRKYPHVHVAVAGADPDRMVESLIRPRLAVDGTADRFHFLGALPLAEVRALVKHSDIHLHPSLWDNAPYSCIEAMAAGRPLVSSDVGGLPELVEHRVTGLLARAGVEQSFVTALQELIEDRDLRARLGAAGRRVVEARHTDVAMAERSVALWQRSIAGDPAVTTHPARTTTT